jgi:hypothetical protein
VGAPQCSGRAGVPLIASLAISGAVPLAELLETATAAIAY